MDLCLQAMVRKKMADSSLPVIRAKLSISKNILTLIV
jgi:hypothetical protein